MRQLSTAEFHDYLVKNDECFIVNPRENLAFRFVDIDGETSYFCKPEGGQEKEIRYDDDYFNEAWLFSMVLTKEEYDNY